MSRLNHQRGEANFGCILWAILLTVAVVICWEAVPVKIANVEFQDYLVEQAKFAHNADARKIRGRVLHKASELDLPLDPKKLHVERTGDRIRIRADYVVPLEYPGYTYEWAFEHDVNRGIYYF